MLRNGAAAPGFTLENADRHALSLSDLRQGKPFVLLFFRGCVCPTAQRDLLAYANVYGRLLSVGATLVAVSADTPENHRTLKSRLDLPFELLSDAEMRVSDQYGVYRSDDPDEPQPHGEPALFVLDVDGKIAYSQVQTGPKGAADPAEIALVLLYMSQNGGRY